MIKLNELREKIDVFITTFKQFNQKLLTKRQSERINSDVMRTKGILTDRINYLKGKIKEEE
jgi:hypothetical protein